MQELVDCVAEGNSKLANDRHLILKFYSSARNQYSLTGGVGSNKTRYYDCLEDCINTAKKYFASLDYLVKKIEPQRCSDCSRVLFLND